MKKNPELAKCKVGVLRMCLHSAEGRVVEKYLRGYTAGEGFASIAFALLTNELTSRDLTGCLLVPYLYEWLKSKHGTIGLNDVVTQVRILWRFRS